MSERNWSVERQLEEVSDPCERIHFSRNEPERCYHLESTAQDECVREVLNGWILEEPPLIGSAREVATLRHLALLVQVAWADGQVSNGQRAIILSAAAMRDIEWEGPAYFRLLDWITKQPSPEFFQTNLRAIRAELCALPSEERTKRYRELIFSCTGVALAAADSSNIAGGINQEEQTLIDRLRRELQDNDEIAGATGVA